MYGNARWGAQRAWGDQAPVRSMVRHMAHELGLVVDRVNMLIYVVLSLLLVALVLLQSRTGH